METQLLTPSLLNEKVKKVTGDILSQAITGELIGMANFAALAGTIDDYSEKMEAVEHAESERGHAIGFIKMAKRNNIEPIVNLQGIYWNSIHQKFLSCANKKDYIACLIIQEIMLESFAVSMYRDAGNALGGEIGKLLIRTSEEEKEHLSHATEILKAELMKEGDEFIKKFHHLHKDCMTILAEWSSNSDVKGHCGVCNGNCMKEDLGEIGLSTRQLRAGALKTYAEALDLIGLPTEQTTVWILNLPI
jgi:fatty aldehyde decarbonylase